MIAHFFIAFGLSFVGSLPFGMINMMVAHTAIEKGLRYALWAAAGAALVEFFQVFIAIKFTWLFTENPATDFWFKLVATVVFFAAGTYFFFFAKMRRKVPEEQQVNSRRSEFFKGALVSSLNLMVIPFWIFYGTLLAANGLLVKDDQHVLAFSCGTAPRCDWSPSQTPRSCHTDRRSAESSWCGTRENGSFAAVRSAPLATPAQTDDRFA